MGLNLSGSWQQGHSATTIPVGVFKVDLQRILPAASVGIVLQRRPARLFHREGLASGTCLRGQEAPTAARATGFSTKRDDQLSRISGSSRTRLDYYCDTVIGRADIEGSKKQRRYERLGCHKPVIPVMCRPSQTPHLTMSSAGSAARSGLGSKEGQRPPPIHGISKITLKVVVFHLRRSSHLSYTSQVISQSRTRVKLNRGLLSPLIPPSPRIPLVRTSSESTVRRPGKAPKGPFPVRSPARHATTSSRPAGSSFEQSTDSRRVRGLGPRAQPSEPILFPEVTDPFCRLPLPTLFHRPEAICTDGRSARARALGFCSDRPRPPTHRGPGACPGGRSIGRRFSAIHFRGLVDSAGLAAQLGTVTRLRFIPHRQFCLPKMAHLELSIPWHGSAKQQRSPTYLKFENRSRALRPDASNHWLYLIELRAELRLSRGKLRRNQLLGGHSSPSFGSRQACSHSNPSQKIKVGRRCNPRGDPASQLPCALRVYSPVDFAHMSDSLVRVSRRGRMGKPTGRCPERACAGERAVTARAAVHDRSGGISTGVSKARA
ncbi:hypothetical protein OIU85_017808 [Salix viminalis]|uniref:Uncharacterized protein n=1 Tax=Salix viminalis TaxID=40686 RepID=A0A9Q0NIE3_SALVM|nr:hypothetical protein OIU85_017808 [Salix viminalis]